MALEELDAVGTLLLEPRPMQVDTPAGAWTFRVSVGSVVVPSVPTTLRSVGDGLLVGRWTATAGADVSLVLVDFLDIARRSAAVRHPEGAAPDQLEGAWGALLRVTALDDGEPLEFAPVLPTETVWDPVGGEYLAALHVERGDAHLTLGGPDGEGLEIGTQDGWLPPRWAGRFAPDPFTQTEFGITVVDGGISWRLPGSTRGEHWELAVAAVWGASDVATWFSVGDVVPPYLHAVVRSRLQQ